MYTSDGATPRSDGSNVLDGVDFRATSKRLVLGEGWQATTDLVYREFHKPVEEGGCSSDWGVLESRLLAIEEPCWATIGQLWGMLHGKEMRLEEKTLCVCACPEDADEHEECCACVCPECVEENEQTHVCTANIGERNQEDSCNDCICSCAADADEHAPDCQCECSECVEHEDVHRAKDYGRQWRRIVNLGAARNSITPALASPETVLSIASFLEDNIGVK